MTKIVLRIAAALSLFSVDVLALENAHEVWGGWLECDSGYVMTREQRCILESEALADRFIVSELPSAGDGAPGTCPSGGCWAPAPRMVVAPAPAERPPLYIQTDHNRPFAVVLDP